MTGVFVVDAILLGMVAEAATLGWWHHRTGRGVPPVLLSANLLSGGCLLLALRFGLAGAGWAPVASCLLGALVAHGTDLRLRWRRS